MINYQLTSIIHNTSICHQQNLKFILIIKFNKNFQNDHTHIFIINTLMQ
jgi:hypothetical protein